MIQFGLLTFGLLSAQVFDFFQGANFLADAPAKTFHIPYAPFIPVPWTNGYGLVQSAILTAFVIVGWDLIDDKKWGESSPRMKALRIAAIMAISLDVYMDLLSYSQWQFNAHKDWGSVGLLPHTSVPAFWVGAVLNIIASVFVEPLVATYANASSSIRSATSRVRNRRIVRLGGDD